jgi:hypothetical protein
MREKDTWEDNEFREIAEKLLKRYPQFFPNDLSLDCIYFIRTATIKPVWISKIRRCGHPWGSMPGLEDIVYLIETSDERWRGLNEAQRILVVFHELKHVPEHGCEMDDEKQRGKIIDHPIQDFAECIAAANGNLFWGAPNQEIPNILEESTDFDLEASLKRAGLIMDEKTNKVTYPNSVHSETEGSSEDEKVSVDQQ